MFSIAGYKHLESFLMTGSTHFIRCIRCHEYSRRHMGLVTFFTFSRHHIRAVRLVTLGTLRDFTMNVMAETTGQAGMLTLHLLQLNDLISVAGQTLFGDIIGKLDNFRGMRIVVTTLAIGQFVVCLVGMTLAAERDNLFY